MRFTKISSGDNFCHQSNLWLTLIGMRGDTLISLFSLDQILSAEFLSKISKLFWSWKLTSIRLIWHLAKLIGSYKKFPRVALKMSIFLDFIAHAKCRYVQWWHFCFLLSFQVMIMSHWQFKSLMRPENFHSIMTWRH